jgi:hypothetical protein
MRRHHFILKLNRHITAEEVQTLPEAGCDDATVQAGPLGTFLDFNREASTMAEALVSAALDLEKIRGLRAVGVYCENLVNLRGIAKMAGVTHEAVRLWATGRRNPGDFPAPVIISPGGEQIWELGPVTDWLRLHKGGAHTFRTGHADRQLQTLSTAHHVLAAREALSRESAETVREFERLSRDGCGRSGSADRQVDAGLSGTLLPDARHKLG